MDRRAFYDADGDLLLVPEQGALTVLTELGALDVAHGVLENGGRVAGATPDRGGAGVRPSASASTVAESVNRAARSITLASWRTFPGQANASRARHASGVSVFAGRP